MSKYARVQNNQVLDVIDFNPAGVFHAQTAALYQSVPDHVQPNAKLVNGQWINPLQPPPSMQEQIALQEAANHAAWLQQESENIRRQRNQLLSASDWTQLSDAPVDKEIWATYRQALRDIPQQNGFPTKTEWPAEPL